MADSVEVVEKKIQDEVAVLKEMIPGTPGATVKEAEIVALVKILASLAAQYIPDVWKPWLGFAAGAIISAIGVWFAKPLPPPVVLETIPIVRPHDPASPAHPTAAHKVTLYVSTKEQAAIAADPSLKGISVHPTMFQADAYFEWQGKRIIVPYAAMTDAAGKVLDVRTFANAADVAAMMKGGK